MDTFSAQQIPTQPVTITPVPSSNPSQEKRSIKKILNLGSWLILFALAPITVLIFLSQDSIPGDFFYPVKRGMESVILAAVSVNPATRTAFRTDLTATRFKEAQSLVVSKSNASGLTTFIDEVQSTQFEVSSLRSDTEREKAEEKLISKIEEYQAGLSALEAKTEQNIITYQSLEISTPTFTPIPTLVPTSAPAASKIQPTATLTSSPTPASTIAPTVPPQKENIQITEQKEIAQTIKETRQEINEIKKDLEEKREKRSEQKENRERRNENKDKNTEE